MTAARRLRDDLQAESRKPDELHGFTKQARTEIGAAGDHLIAAAGREAARGVGQRRAGRRPARPGRSRSAGPMPTPSPRHWASGPWWQQWEGTVPDHRSCARRSSSRRCPSRARVDPRLPHGRADHHLVRPRPAARVPRRTRGHRRRHPGRPRRGRHPGRGRAGPEPGRPTVYHVASGVRNPLRYGHLVELSDRLLPAATRSTTSGASPSTCPSGPSRGAGGCSASSSGPTPS